MLLRWGLHLADVAVRSLPSGAAYALADLVGRGWYRLAGQRRRLVAESLGRVAAATGRPTSGPAFRRMVEGAFIGYARYWVELLRAPHYPADQLEEILHIAPQTWATIEPIMRGGAVVAVPHIGNFEPFGHFMVMHGLRTVAPIEEIKPRELYEFLLARRVGGQRLEIVPLQHAYRPMLATLRAGGVAGMVADRDLDGHGIGVTIFGHATTLPAGPATLALRTGRPLLVGRVLRAGPERFVGDAWLVEAPRSGDARADVAALTRAVATGFERAIAEAPDQWWAVFQPFWTDQRERAERERAGRERAADGRPPGARP
jgi:KDO2-lipid IV(A) lauroyltransferase